MSSIGTGYDLAASTFSPDGRIFQLEYAQKALDNSCNVIALTCKDGVVLACDKTVVSNLYVKNCDPRIINVSDNVGTAIVGVYPDGRALTDYAVQETLKYFDSTNTSIKSDKLSKQISEYMHIFTLGIHRPFGAGLFFAEWRPTEGSFLYFVDPTGLRYKYFAWAAGKHKQSAKTEMEKLKLETLPVDQAVKEAAKILLTLREEGRDKNCRLEMGWTGAHTNGKFEAVPEKVVEEAQAWARAKIDEEDQDD
ncbi:Proteasome subunit alpha type-3 [Strongyloides ratti]|uniref:Proteasome subunit alpha type n=1 Tax=Strongyloides ratti TaxID=34506 RepID=A0A090L4Y1_STRRB|nr:Proteasome subunit alpha type-3 [Strongyloides ratti]CEF62554.1 Proteasome subunit alpha type-3 [Strongyloides ratti]